jgi:predicted MFS family arabinose efflux permease
MFPDLAASAGVRMERANGIRAGIQQGSLLVGAPLGGVLVTQLGSTTALWLDAASFLVSAALVATAIPVVHREIPPEAPTRYLGELAEGLRFISRDRLFRALVATSLATNLLDAPFPVAMPVFAREAFGSATDLGVMYGVFCGCALLGALAYSAAGHRLPRRATYLTAYAFVPSCT